MTDQAGPEGPVGQRIKAGPSPWAFVLLVIGVLIGGFGVALGVNTSSRVVAGLAGGVVALAALAGLASWTEIQGSQITAHSLRGRRILRLDRLAALDRADQRLRDGTYGLSVRSGKPIPDERLEAYPTAELTVEEASQGS